MTIGSRLKEVRESRGFSQEAFGAVAGVSKQAQLRYEKGERNPDAEYFANVAKIGCDVQYIITGEPSSAKLTNDEIQLLELFRGADLSIKAAAMAVLESKVNRFKENVEITVGSHVSGSGNTIEIDMKKGKQ